MRSKNNLIILFLLADLVLLILGIFNLRTYIDKPGLPAEYQAVINDFSFDVKNIYKKEKIIEFDGKAINKNGLIDYYMLSHRYDDKVRIKSIGIEGKITEDTVSLTKCYYFYEIVIIFIVTLFFFFTGIFILLRYRSTSFAFIIHTLSISTGMMIILDWGDLITYSKIINYIIFLGFEASIYLVPTLFLHLSFTYPVRSRERSMYLLTPFYCAAITFIIISYIQITWIFYFGGDISKMYFLNFHTTIADVYLVLVLTLTIAKFEHSALTIEDVTHKKQIYWALSGITFGPLIYVFLCLIPRILMGHELVSLVFMQFTTVIAPVMLLVSVTRNKEEYYPEITKRLVHT
ncbi:MAG: hypothetical protein ACM34K_03090 [Bacillota bacterium]